MVTSVVEPWSRYKNTAGEIITCVERRAPDFGSVIAVKSVQSEGLMTQFQIHWRSEAENPTRVIGVDYRLQINAFTVQRVVDGVKAKMQKKMTELYIPSPLMRVFTGQVIRQLITAGGCAQVLTPWINNPQDNQRLLTPQLGERQARTLTRGESVTVRGAQLHCDRCEYLGDQYQPGTEFWIDQTGLLQRYRWRQDEKTLWDVELAEYQQSPGV